MLKFCKYYNLAKGGGGDEAPLPNPPVVPLATACSYKLNVIFIVLAPAIGRFSDDITMPIVWFLLQIVVKFAHLNQW